MKVDVVVHDNQSELAFNFLSCSEKMKANWMQWAFPLGSFDN